LHDVLLCDGIGDKQPRRNKRRPQAQESPYSFPWDVSPGGFKPKRNRRL
jgi:hypothetical protein